MPPRRIPSPRSYWAPTPSRSWVIEPEARPAIEMASNPSGRTSRTEKEATESSVVTSPTRTAPSRSAPRSHPRPAVASERVNCELAEYVSRVDGVASR